MNYRVMSLVTFSTYSQKKKPLCLQTKLLPFCINLSFHFFVFCVIGWSMGAHCYTLQHTMAIYQPLRSYYPSELMWTCEITKVPHPCIEPKILKLWRYECHNYWNDLWQLNQNLYFTWNQVAVLTLTVKSWVFLWF